MKKLLCYLALVLSLMLTVGQVKGDPERCSAPESTQSITDYALEIATADGHKQPKYVVGIIQVESKAGKSDSFRVVKQGQSRFYGIGQVSIGAAKAVMKRFPGLWNDFNTQSEDELKARLILDDKFNVRITSKYLLMMGVNKNANKGIAAYNVGLGGVETINPNTNEYTQRVKLAIR